MWKGEDFRREMKKIDKTVADTVEALISDGVGLEWKNDGSIINLKVTGHEINLSVKEPFQIKIGETIYNYRLADVIRARVLHPDLSPTEALHKIGAKPHNQ